MLRENLLLVSRSLAISSKCSFCRTSSKLSQKYIETRPEASIKATNVLLGKEYIVDEWTNITPKIISKLGRNLLWKRNHPICIVKQRIINFFHQKYGAYAGSSSPLFSAYEDFSPVVSKQQNFDDLLIPQDHVARSKSDNYYINQDYLLRTHTSAHQTELIRAGLPAFLVFGDVYRRDKIDSTHYPVFHQCEGVRLFTKYQLFPGSDVVPSPSATPPGEGESVLQQPQLFAQHERTADHQETLTMEASKMLEYDLKLCLEDLVTCLFAKKMKTRWILEYFPFTHPSWELEVEHNGKWIEILGCGVIEQKLNVNAGCTDRVGWAFGIGLDRIAMMLYDIPDIRLLWSEDERFIKQFDVASKGIDYSFSFKPYSNYTPLYNDISFWLKDPEAFNENDFCDLVREIGGDLVEQVECFDTYNCPKTGRTSKAFNLTFRHLEKVLTQADVNEVKKNIEQAVESKLGGTVR